MLAVLRALLWICWLSGTVSAQVTRREVLEMAEAYRTFVWTPTAANVFHGFDAKGIRVDTPDADFRPPDLRPGWWIVGHPNVGVPYQWGGFCTLAEFAQGVQAGRAAGDVYTLAKRRALDDAVSAQAVGIDCSGFVSRCWKLERSYSTRELPALCVELRSYAELQPGDILNSHNNHVLIFKSWADAAKTRLLGYETGSPPTWKVVLNDIPVGLLREQNFKGYRYRRIRD